MFDVATLLANQPVPDGQPRRDRHERRRSRDPVRRHVRGARPGRPRAAETRRWPSSTSFLPDEASVDNPVDMIASASRRGLRAHDPHRGGRSGHRRVDRDLHPAARGRRARGRAAHGRGDRLDRATDPGAHVLHVGAGTPRGAAGARRQDPLVRLSRSRPRSPSRTRPSWARGARSPHGDDRRASTGCARTRPRPCIAAALDARRGVAHPRRGPTAVRLLRPSDRAGQSAPRRRRRPPRPSLAFHGRVALKAIGPVHKTDVGRGGRST